MIRILTILIVISTLAACNNSNTSTTTIQNEIVSKPKNCVEILYFHGNKRCITCNAIESLTKEVVNENFPKQLKNGEIQLRVIDISTKDGEEIANKYEVAWSSLYINKWSNGKETRNNITDFGFANAKASPNVFKAGIKAKLDTLLK